MFIYVIGPKIGHQKIGISNNVERRLKAIQTGNPEKLYIHHTEPVNPKIVMIMERAIHRELNHKKQKGEWFSLTPEEARDFVIFFNIRYADDPLFGI